MRKADQMKFLTATALILMAFVWFPAHSSDLKGHIIEKARQCFAQGEVPLEQPLSVTYDLVFRRNGLVDLVQTVAIRPDTPETRLVAADMGASFVHCGPYEIDGARKITLTVWWPGEIQTGVTAQ